MTKKLELYKCEICGNLVEVVLSGAGELVCCGEPMNLLHSATVEASAEKHIPIFEKNGEELIVRVGEVSHPMEQGHYIQFIEVYSPDQKYIKRKYLNPGDEPILNLKCYDVNPLTARELCNLHGLWEAKYD